MEEASKNVVTKNQGHTVKPKKKLLTFFTGKS